MIKERLSKNPIMAAAKFENIEKALASNAQLVVLMNGKLNQLMNNPLEKWNKQKPIFIHVDLLKGLGSDHESIKFIKKYVKVTGIVSTKNNILNSAKKEGLLCIQRIFLIDTRSLKNSINSILDTKPDAVEIMPAIAPSIVKVFKEKIDVPIILSGLVSSEKIIYEALKAGADGISMSNEKLWQFNLK